MNTDNFYTIFYLLLAVFVLTDPALIAFIKTVIKG